MIVELTSWICAVREQGGLLTAAAREAALDSTVPTCPEWRVRDLLLHTGSVHRWAATFVREARTEPLGMVAPQDVLEKLSKDSELVDWYAESYQILVEALETAPPDLVCWTFMPTAPTGSRFWARRQAHELTIHRVDVESVLGRLTPVSAELATDGLDELLSGFLPRNRFLRTEKSRTLLIHATDTDARWLIHIGPDQPAATVLDAATGATDAAISGPANALYLALWNRLPLTDLNTDGDSSLLDLWANKVQVRWP